MTTQQKIEFYLSKGFAVKCNWKKTWCGEECESIYYFKNETGDFVGQDTENKQLIFWSKRKCDPDTITPIPPKPYEFKVGERVITDTGEIETIELVMRYRYIRTTVGHEYMWYLLVPALPEDEECEVVEVINNGDSIMVGAIFNFTKPDGKKLKIKVVEKPYTPKDFKSNQ